MLIKLVEDKQTTLIKDIDVRSETPVNNIAKDNDSASTDNQVKADDSISCEKSKVEAVFKCDICTYKSNSEHGIKIHKAKKHTYTCRCCYRNFTDQADYSNHTSECFPSYYDSPMRGSAQFPPRFPPNFPS